MENELFTTMWNEKCLGENEIAPANHFKRQSASEGGDVVYLVGLEKYCVL